MSGAEGQERKQEYFNKLIKLLDEFPKIFIVLADNVGSTHMQNIRKALRGKGILLMGKNTMIRKAIRGHIQNNPALEQLLPHVKNNIGFIFTKTDLSEVKKIITANKVAAPAKAGSVAPCDVVVPAGNTGLEPTQTSFLQALNIPSKITRGQIEITNDIHLIKEGNKVGASESNLLSKLNIKPFQYGLKINAVYDNGAVYDAKVLDMSDDDIVAKFRNGIKNVASASLGVGIPTLASLPHSVARGYKNVLSIALGTEFSFPKADKIKEMLKNPGAFAAPVVTAPVKEDKKAAAPAKVKEEPKEEEDEDMGFGLFD